MECFHGITSARKVGLHPVQASHYSRADSVCPSEERLGVIGKCWSCNLRGRLARRVSHLRGTISTERREIPFVSKQHQWKMFDRLWTSLMVNRSGVNGSWL